MKALIDGDILRYEIGCATDDEGRPLSWPLVKARVDGKIKSIAEKAGADSHVVHMSGRENFRKDIATIRPYKGNRNAEKPHWHDEIEKYLKSGLNHDVFIAEGMEADDSMGIEQCTSDEETIICSRDKDLKMIPGWHCQWGTSNSEAKGPWFVSEEEGIKFFFTQLLTGDSTDNIPGLYMVGPTNAKRFLDGITEPLRLYSAVQQQYEKRFGSYWPMFMYENAELLWIKRELGDPKFPGHEAQDILDEFQCQLEEEEVILDVW